MNGWYALGFLAAVAPFIPWLHSLELKLEAWSERRAVR